MRNRMNPLRGYLAERLKHKTPFAHVWMGYGESPRIHNKIVIQKNIEINSAVFIVPAGRFMLTPQLPFRLLQNLKQPHRLKLRFNHRRAVKKAVPALKTPRLRFPQGRYPHHPATALSQQAQRTLQPPPAIAQVAAKSNQCSVQSLDLPNQQSASHRHKAQSDTSG